VYALLVFKVFMKTFTFLYIFVNFFCFFEITEMLLINPFSVFGRCSPVSAPHWLQKNAQELTGHRRLPAWFYRIASGFLYAFLVSKLLLATCGYLYCSAPLLSEANHWGTFPVNLHGHLGISTLDNGKEMYRTSGVLFFIDYCTAPRDT
jgi:hypothetical protein